MKNAYLVYIKTTVYSRKIRFVDECDDKIYIKYKNRSIIHSGIQKKENNRKSSSTSSTYLLKQRYIGKEM